jgi:hypothetical protein
MMRNSYRVASRMAVLAVALAASAACSKKEKTTQTSGGALAPIGGSSSTMLVVTDVDLGKAIDAEKRVVERTQDFRSNDTVYGSVHTVGVAEGATLTARWSYENGQTVDERSETISPTGETYTEFHIAKPSGWPAGRYTLHVLLNGQEVQTKPFTVRK